ncbi:peroxisome assembly protein 12-like [Paramacrobiotus metropolitanus]|uniref:peroxisome assembly protein 12-like n=1 Tax=Paramacrobiotus metropolitanus TaxID=2943436 RepID=UPI002445D1F1|nr:peroxisome assembly protein 12-like [Paramacrobiotus metropolitanus]
MMDVAGYPEVFAARNLSDTFRNAVAYVLKLLSKDYLPVKLRNLIEALHDEIVFALDLLLNLYHLRYFHASWAEKYAGLIRRTPGRFVIAKSLLDLAIVPYIFRKWEKLYLRLRDRCRSSSGVQSRFVACYPYVRYVAAFLNVYILLRYLLRKIPHPGLLLFLLDIRLQRRSLADIPEVSLQSSLGERLLHGGFRAFSALLTVGGGLAQFWRQYGEEVRDAMVGVPSPPRLPDSCVVLRPGRCPVCGQGWRQPVAVPATGIVFCRMCVLPIVEATGKCPLTRCSLDVNALVPLYL